jgi:hypothetical protein
MGRREGKGGEMEKRADGDALRLKFGSLKLFAFASQSHDPLFQTALPIPITSLPICLRLIHDVRSNYNQWSFDNTPI